MDSVAPINPSSWVLEAKTKINKSYKIIGKRERKGKGEGKGGEDRGTSAILFL